MIRPVKRVLLQTSWGWGSDTYNFDRRLVDLDFETGDVRPAPLLYRLGAFFFGRYGPTYRYPHGYDERAEMWTDLANGRIRPERLKKIKEGLESANEIAEN